MGDPVEIVFSRDEAIVLFEFLARFMDEETLRIEDGAETRALWNMQCELERTLTEPLLANYNEILQAARDRLRDPL